MTSSNLERIINSEKRGKLKKNLWYIVPIFLILGLIVILYVKYGSQITVHNLTQALDWHLLIFVIIGVFAQLVDGTLGMGYGATSTTFLMTFGVPPAISSTAVHVAEMFTTGASAMSHHKFKNINKRLVQKLLLPGVLGAILGAYLLSDVVDGKVIKPYIAIYMIILASIIIYKGLKKNVIKKKSQPLGILAIFGGFMDSIGGGGWGPIVTSSLMGRGGDPKYTIGSVNAAEFAVAFASGITFIIFDGINGWQVIIGLVIGGIICAPFSAYFVNKVPRTAMTIMIGVLLILLSSRTIYLSF